MQFRPPIQFVTLILALWIGFRWIVWAPAPLPSPQLHPGVKLASAEPKASSGISGSDPGLLELRTGRIAHGHPLAPPYSTTADGAVLNANRAMEIAVPARQESHSVPDRQAVLPLPNGPIASLRRDTSRARNLSVAIWAQWRADIGIEPLANAGELGGSQAGVRISYPIVEAGPAQISLAARLSSPIDGQDGAEAALGIAVQPLDSAPIAIMIDRRIALAREGRNAWSIGVAGGVYRKPVGLGFELDGYAQTGIVGANSRDLFVDGSAAISRPIEIGNRVNLSLGAGVWGGAQPGITRLDIGPEMGLRFSNGDMGVRLAVGWRQRITGTAEPGSGPALTLGVDF